VFTRRPYGARKILLPTLLLHKKTRRAAEG